MKAPRMLDEALRTAPVALSANAAMWLTRWHKIPYTDPPIQSGERPLWLYVEDAAWMLAQHQILDGRLRTIAFSEQDCAEAERLGASFNDPAPAPLRSAGPARPLSDRMKAATRALANAHRAATMPPSEPSEGAA